MKLDDIAEVNIGILLNREIKNEGNNPYKIFNLKQYDENEEYEIYKLKNNYNTKLTKKGDLLFRMVYPNRLIYVDKNLENLLVSSQMCIIRCNKNKMNSIFLKWYLESDIAKEKMKGDLIGTTIQKISVSSLRKIEVPNISLNIQEKIKDLIMLWENEKKVINEMVQYKEILYTTLIYEILENEGEENC